MFLQALLDTPDRQIPTNALGLIVDVRDVAKAHLLALSSPPLKGTNKRLIVNNKNFTWSEVVRVIRASKEYAGESVLKRLPLEDAESGAQITTPLDDSLTQKAIGFGEYVDFEKTVVDTFGAVLAWEKQVKA